MNPSCEVPPGEYETRDFSLVFMCGKRSFHDTNHFFRKMPKSMLTASHTKIWSAAEIKKWFSYHEKKPHWSTATFLVFPQVLEVVATTVRNNRSKNYKWGKSWRLLLKNTQENTCKQQTKGLVHEVLSMTSHHLTDWPSS